MNIYKRRFINYWNMRGSTPSHVSLTYREQGIDFNDVREIGTEVSGPLGLAANYTVSGTTITSLYTNDVFNSIDVNWNGAQLPTSVSGVNATIRTTSDLLNYVKELRTDMLTISPQ